MFAGTFRSSLGPRIRPIRKKPFADDNDLVGELIRQEEALLRFSEECRIPDEFLGELRVHRVAGGAEHEVFIPDGGSRVWKQTKRDRWGFKKDTPNDYLERLHALTSYAESLAILIEGIAVQNGIPSMATTPGVSPYFRHCASTRIGPSDLLKPALWTAGLRLSALGKELQRLADRHSPA